MSDLREKCLGDSAEGIKKKKALYDRHKQLCHILRETEVILANQKGVANSTQCSEGGGWWPFKTEWRH